MRFLFITILSVSIFSCETIPNDALKITEKNIKLRQIQQKEYTNISEEKMLIASANVLQDTGYIIKQSRPNLGLLVAEKDRDATDTGQVVAALALLALAAYSGTSSDVAIDKQQKIRISLTTRIKNENTIRVRVNFQRIIWDTNNDISKQEYISDAKIYQDFFNKLDKSVFLAKEGI